MADYTVTAANVIPQAGCEQRVGIAGEAFGIGVSIYKKASDGRWYKGDQDVAQADAIDYAISLTAPAAAGQPVVHTGDSGRVAFGDGVFAVGDEVFEGEAAGGLCPAADIGSAEYRRRHGFAKTTSILQIDKGWSTEPRA